MALKNKECRTLEGVIYLLKISYVDGGLFDREMFRFFCKTKEMNAEFFRCNFDYFILRLDLGMKAISPYYTKTEEHYPISNPNFKRDYALHFAVGLPF